MLLGTVGNLSSVSVKWIHLGVEVSKFFRTNNNNLRFIKVLLNTDGFVRNRGYWPKAVYSTSI